MATTTDPHFTLPQTAASLAIDPAFAGYYAAHTGAALLGSVLTPALPTSLGLVQFFTAGALLQPNAQAQALIKQSQQPQTQGKSTAHQTAIPQVFGPTTQQVLRDSLYVSDGSVVQLAIFHALLSAGSTVPIGGDTGSLSYAALRSALQPSRLVTIPAESEIDPQSHIHTAPNVFITEGKKGTASVGHTIPDIFWGYMTRSDIAPDGWDVDFGQPLTEALPLTTLRGGQLHHLTAQAFWNAVLIADNDAPDATGQPSVQVLDIGRAYLQTFGPPKLDIHANEQVWATGDTAVLDTVTSTTAKIHVGQAFPFTLAGDTQWVHGVLWYHVHWQTPRNGGDGWVSASAL
ncbi:MAG: serine hydrolase, partial [Ktedonobacterales bacterium]